MSIFQKFAKYYQLNKILTRLRRAMNIIKVCELHAERFRLLAKAIHVMMLIPSNSSCIERMFRAVKLIKSPIRSSLKENKLEKLVFVSINGPNLEDFDFVTFVNKF